MALISGNHDLEAQGGIGLGTSKADIQKMIDKIWKDFDVDDSGTLTKHELKGFIQKAFQLAGIRYEFSSFEFD